ncbi:hypothetical protein LQF12_02320 [Ruania suaedae]|uniref:hypothetical protein n=1 Tax=Ruania suaedae TaxID=2897774 RepID=UPI001E415EB9|nr:hypothetical protein [Ruania suaedae]UFU03468.1 hypothetical protein LQF12_02320 [Ruania suaedae]
MTPTLTPLDDLTEARAQLIMRARTLEEMHEQMAGSTVLLLSRGASAVELQRLADSYEYRYEQLEES